jgi:hydrogenase-4 component B
MLLLPHRGGGSLNPGPYLSPSSLASDSVILLLVSAFLAPVLGRSQRYLIIFGYAMSALASLLAVVSGAAAMIMNETFRTVLPLGLPDLPFHLRLDPLAGFFLVVIGLLGLFVSLYSTGYVRGFLGKRSVTRLVVFYCIFIAGMFMVVLSDDALIFLISWEVMAVASYFLVMYEDERALNRRAAFLYIVVAHVGAIAILLSFGIMAGLAKGFYGFGGYTFDAMRSTEFSGGWATAAFLLAFFGFAAKAGVIPLHVWLPEAHPVAPSNVSALMSGVMLKTAVYGIVRVTFDLIGTFPWWWGVLVLVFGLVSSVLGVLYALMQHDLKRLLAYHSVENVGIILIGVGLAIVFASFGLHMLAALALVAALYHTLNHAVFKGLLFMGAGAVLHATNERDMEEMGGLIHVMPWTAVLFLVGCVSISALPPFNGFVSEWLTFQAFLLTPSLETPLLRLIIPLGAALLALTSALAAACFVKVFGVTFLGHWRGRHSIQQIHEVNRPMRAGMSLAAVTCLALGIFPTFIIRWMDVVPGQLLDATIAGSAAGAGWMWLTPVSPERASYSGPIVFLVISAVCVVAYLVLHTRSAAIHRSHIWDCGFEKLTPRMQYSAASFSMPIRRIFGFYFNIREQVKSPPDASGRFFPSRLSYSLRVRDRLWGWIYSPAIEISFWLSRKVGRLQQGRIHIYLIYSFATIILLLVFMR